LQSCARPAVVFEDKLLPAPFSPVLEVQTVPKPELVASTAKAPSGFTD